MRFEVFTAVTIMITFFWVWASCGWLVEANVSPKRTVSIFRAEVTMLGFRGQDGESEGKGKKKTE
jgi:hypothetical protein